ncbi:MAG TPA: hypothetical protein VFW29_06320 [Solirubrobacteraceae bacterium]|nr:hypothetical protein [Solirubrobacteraceae bacterium]
MLCRAAISTVTALLGATLIGCGSTGHRSAAGGAGATAARDAGLAPAVTVTGVLGAARMRFVTRADAICGAANTHLAPVDGELQLYGEHQEYAAAAGTLRSVLAYERSELARLRALHAPEGAQEELTAIWKAAETQVDDVATLVQDFAAGELVEAQSTESKLQRDYAAYGRLARRFGMSNCGSG